MKRTSKLAIDPTEMLNMGRVLGETLNHDGARTSKTAAQGARRATHLSSTYDGTSVMDRRTTTAGGMTSMR